ncbi:response regulator, partial [Microbacterium sp. Leaf351]
MIGVMIVDDEALTLELHRSYVERLPGFEVVAECTSARAAHRALVEQPPPGGIDLVLLDVTMPDGTGVDVLRQARAAGVDVDVVAVTSVRDAE